MGPLRVSGKQNGARCIAEGAVGQRGSGHSVRHQRAYGAICVARPYFKRADDEASLWSVLSGTRGLPVLHGYPPEALRSAGPHLFVLAGMVLLAGAILAKGRRTHAQYLQQDGGGGPTVTYVGFCS